MLKVESRVREGDKVINLLSGESLSRLMNCNKIVRIKQKLYFLEKPFNSAPTDHQQVENNYSDGVEGLMLILRVM